MEQNHIAQSAFAPETATNEPVSTANPEAPAAAADDFEFASAAEADAYWAGVADGIRNGGNIPAPRLAARARDTYPELVATAEQLRDRDILDFDPVSLRHRTDGWTPQKQREYVEALADSGVARYAAGRVNMSEQSANRLRRRPEARSFDRACESAMRIGARRLVSVAFERAIEGTIKRHTYHGEVRSEERVYDNRLLIALIGKLGPLVAPPDAPDPVADNWQPWMEAIEQGLPEPDLSEVEGLRAREPEPSPKPHEAFSVESADTFSNCDVWEEGDEWRTNFPPPPGFTGDAEGELGGDDYQRGLTEAELRAIGADEESQVEALAEQLAEESAARDRYFGFTPKVFPPRDHELYETSAEPPDDSGAIAGVGEARPAGPPE